MAIGDRPVNLQGQAVVKQPGHRAAHHGDTHQKAGRVHADTELVAGRRPVMAVQQIAEGGRHRVGDRD
jgi:hypothetical protein